MTAVSTAAVAWRGTGDETERLLAAVARNCGCGFGPVGGRLSTCAVHQMLNRLSADANRRRPVGVA